MVFKYFIIESKEYLKLQFSRSVWFEILINIQISPNLNVFRKIIIHATFNLTLVMYFVGYASSFLVVEKLKHQLV